MKKKLRKEIIYKRKKLSKEENRKKSKKIKEILFGLPEFKNAKTVFFYISYNGEVFTHDMIRESFLRKNVIVPISNIKDETLILSQLKSWDELTVGTYRILEPRIEKIRRIEPSEIDLIIVPGVAFDKSGNRLGHGKGYYDKLLQNTNAKTVGLAFEFQIVNEVPTESHDKAIDILITEKGKLDFN
jgi:5-formyltetrahydrofolate cyclo-ligase